MTYRVRIDPVAMRQIDQFAAYLRSYDEDFAIDQIQRLDRIFKFNLGESPLTWSYFPLTGAPYRGYLFRVGRRTQYWIIYSVNEDSRIVDVLSFWNTARDPKTLTLRRRRPLPSSARPKRPSRRRRSRTR
jgi:mRNA-degrading endonuclease RelE of RelBE toxin-antitoxin system